MKLLTVYFSFFGNNRQLAEYVAELTGCDIRTVVERKRRRLLTVFLDMFFNRRPRIEPLDCRLADYDHVVLIAPVWAAKVANPMKSLLEAERDGLPGYSFMSLCGYDRPGQAEKIKRELSDLAGRPPAALVQLKICDLLPAQQQSDIKAISAYRVTREDLCRFEPHISDFLKSLQEV